MDTHHLPGFADQSSECGFDFHDAPKYSSAMKSSVLLEQAKSLPVRERIRLVQDIWDTIREDNVELTAEQAAELDRRMEDHKRNPNSVVSREEVEARLKAKYSRRK
jgi:putative addiction module component (TIGR02574 family)